MHMLGTGLHVICVRTITVWDVFLKAMHASFLLTRAMNISDLRICFFVYIHARRRAFLFC